MTHRPRVPYDVWRQTLPTPMSKQVALKFANFSRAVQTEGAKLIDGVWHVYADAPDPRNKCRSGMLSVSQYAEREGISRSNAHWRLSRLSPPPVRSRIIGVSGRHRTSISIPIDAVYTPGVGGRPRMPVGVRRGETKRKNGKT